VKSEGKPGEKSEEAIVLMRGETTQLAEREGPLLQPSRVRRYVTVHALKGQPHPKTNHKNFSAN
jgi:hypothetical protein